MIISLRADGTATMLEPSHVYQGSNVADVYVIAPFPNTTALQVGFTLPNGTTASAPMTYVQDSENNLVVWQYTISSAITNEAGAASVSITATTQTGQVIASQSVPFTIEETTLPVLPDTPSQDEWSLVLQYIQQNSANIAKLQGQVSAIEADVDTANTNASAAVSTANEAQQTANEAQETANGYASQSEALETANQAESSAASNTAAIEGIVSGTTIVAKSDSANSATSAESATSDGDGNNIKDTYATKTELSTGNANTLAAAQNYTNQALSNYSIIEIVQTLPETGDTGKIYLVPKADSTSGDLYSEYLWNGSAWELIGTVSATSGTTIKVNGVSQIEVDFDSDPQTQITANATAISNIVNGTTIVPNATNAQNAQTAVSAQSATNDGDGNNIQNTYAKKSEYNFISNAQAFIPNGGGWFTIASCELLNGASALITVNHRFESNQPFSVNFAFSQTGYGKSVLTVLSSQGQTSGFKLRYLYGERGNSPLQIYVPYPAGDGNTYFVSVVSSRPGGVIAEINTTADTTATPSDGKSVEIDIPQDCGINTTGGVYQNGNQVANQNGTYSSLLSGGNTIVDTRGTTPLPSDYAEKRTFYEFKNASDIGVEQYFTGTSFILLKSEKGWTADYCVYQEAVAAGSTNPVISSQIKVCRYGIGSTWTNWKTVLAVDPTTLTPSIANGWTEGNPASNLPPHSVYLMKLETSNGGGNTPIFWFFMGEILGQGSTVYYQGGLNAYACYVVQGGTGVQAYANSTDLDITTVWYKKIA